MSTAAPPPAGPAPSGSGSSDSGMISGGKRSSRSGGQPAGSSGSAWEKLISERLAEAASALWWAELTRRGLALVLGLLAVILVWIAVDQWIYAPPAAIRVLVFAAAAFGVVGYVARRIVPLWKSQVLPEYAARSLERDLPELRQSLTSYVMLRESSSAAGLGGRVVRSIGSTTAGRLRDHDALPAEATGTMRWWVATAATLAVLVAYALLSPKNSLQSAARLVAPLSSIEAPSRVSITGVEPGDVQALAGRPIDVAAVVTGLGDDEAVEFQVAWQKAASDSSVVLQQDESASATRYTGVVDVPQFASGDLRYRIVAGDAIAGPFTLSVLDLPVVAIESIQYRPPAYTMRQPYTNTGGAISAIDGTEVTVSASVNRPISRATIEFNPRPIGQTVQATAGVREMKIGPDGQSVSTSFALRGQRGRASAVPLDSYRIRVWDDADHSNPEPIVYPIKVIPDLPPEIAIMMPVESPKAVPINAQQIIEVHASDPDFGLSEIRLEMRRGLDLIGEPVLWRSDSVGEAAAANTAESSGTESSGTLGNQVAEFRFRPGKDGLGGLGLNIGDTVKVVALAIDNRRLDGPVGAEPNMTRTDAIELKIVAADNQLPGQDASGEGLSSPDERPPSDASSDAPSEGSSEGQQQAGGSGSGGGDGESGEQQSGSGQSGEGQSGQGQSGEGQSGEGQSGSGGSQSGDQQNAGNQDAGNSASGGNASDGADSSAADDKSMNPSDQPGQPGGEPSSNDQPMTDQSSADQPSGDSSAADPSGADQGGEPVDGQEQTPSAGSGASDGSQPSPPDGSSQPGQSGESAPSSPESQSPPQHDAEAFERIKDYLEQNQGTPTENGGSENDPSTETGGTQSGQGQETQGQESQGQESQGQESMDSNPESQDSGGQESADQGKGQADPSGDSQQGSPGDDSGSSNPGSSESSQQKLGEEGGEQAQQGEQQGDGTKDAKQEGSKQDDGEPQPGAGQADQPQDAPPQDAGGDGQQEMSDGQSGESQSSESPSSDSQSSESQSSDSQASDGSPGDESTGEGQAGDSPSNDDASGQSDPTSKDGSQNESNPSDASQGDASQSDASEGAGARPSPSDSPPSDSSRSSASQSSGDGQPGTGNGTGESGDSSATVPPDPANLEYTKKATDMVLDYLDQTRDQPDQELLDRLNWTQDDLKQFRQRWQDVRGVDPAAPAGDRPSRDVEEALRSLGMRPPGTSSAKSQSDSADGLRGIRDSGNRRPPPAAYRDAFDAFRRAIGGGGQ